MIKMLFLNSYFESSSQNQSLEANCLLHYFLKVQCSFILCVYIVYFCIIFVSCAYMIFLFRFSVNELAFMIYLLYVVGM